MRLQDARSDLYRRLARERGYRSRAAFKLIQADAKYHIIREGDVVIDLGAAPGGWVQVASEKVGPKGVVVALDILPIKISEPNVRSVTGDIFEELSVARLKSMLPRKADVLLSDLSPKLTGSWDLDHYRQVELALRSLRLTGELLRKGGSTMVKVFDGDRLLEVRREAAARFRVATIIKPKASRPESSELYILGLGHMG